MNVEASTQPVNFVELRRYRPDEEQIPFIYSLRTSRTNLCGTHLAIDRSRITAPINIFIGPSIWLAPRLRRHSFRYRTAAVSNRRLAARSAGRLAASLAHRFSLSPFPFCSSR